MRKKIPPRQVFGRFGPSGQDLHWGETSLVGNLYCGEVTYSLLALTHSLPYTYSSYLSAGFGSAFFAVLYSGVFYWLYASAITELAARYRTSGGSFDFVKAAMGKKYAALMVLILTHSLIHSLTHSLPHAGSIRIIKINSSKCWVGFIHLFIPNIC